MENSGSDCSSVDDAIDCVGICGIEFYFPRTYVAQDDLEKYDGVDSGKYTSGLGQLEMSFCGDNEDVCSMALTVTSALLKNYQVDPSLIGYLAVGTETLIDKSKSVKSTLMDLFPGNVNIQGADVKNACYGGTEALFGAVDWLRANHAYDCRMAIVVCVDIAIYAAGPARCTGGAGAIAFLLDVNAPLVIERGMRVNYANNVYDFYKPISDAQACCEYPIVDGSCSIECYLNAVSATYKLLCDATKRNFKHEIADLSLYDFHACIFHSPFTKLTQKALSTMAFIDFLHNSERATKADTAVNGYSANKFDSAANNRIHKFPSRSKDSSVQYLLTSAKELEEFRSLKPNQWSCRKFLAATLKAAQPLIAEKLDPYVEFCRRLGNMYTTSLYAQLAGVLHKSASAAEMDRKRVLMFSYGSGCIAAMFSLQFNLSSMACQECYERIQKGIKRAHNRLDERVKFSPNEYTSTLEARERLVRSEPHRLAPYTPTWSEALQSHKVNGGIHSAVNGETHCAVNGLSLPTNGNRNAVIPLFPGTFYLAQVDVKYRRFYVQTTSAL